MMSPHSQPGLNGCVGRYVGRFAPSPTGLLHFGSLVAAVASYLDARANNGLWLLRIEDIDATRCKQVYADDIIGTLHTFGFRWDGEIVVQSQQIPRYEDALRQLVENRHVYGCVCTRREISDAGTSGIDGPVYPGTCRTAGYLVNNIAARVRTDDRFISFDDRVQGIQRQQLARDVGDFVVKRRDQLFAYQLAVVVDDHSGGVTDIVRGADLLDSTARQLYLQTLLGFVAPRYMHIPVAANSDGQKLSKQTLAPAISPKNVILTLHACLDFLSQPDLKSTGVSDPAKLLEMAGRQWQPGAIRNARFIPAIPQMGEG